MDNWINNFFFKQLAWGITRSFIPLLTFFGESSLPQKQGNLIVANFRNSLDYFILATCFESNFKFCLNQNEKIPGLSQSAQESLQYLELQKNNEENYALLTKALDEKENILLFLNEEKIFSEQTSPKLELLQRILINSNYNYLPVFIDGSENILPAGKLIPSVTAVNVLSACPAINPTENLSISRIKSDFKLLQQAIKSENIDEIPSIFQKAKIKV